jgi:hypothetical protein
MPQVLTTNALIMCPHGGVGTTTPSDPKWTVNGGFVLLEGDTGVLACLFVQAPCSTYTLKSMGLNATTIDGRKVILVTDFNQSVTGLPLTMTEFHQVYDNSTPAPIPTGQSAPPLPGPLADAIKPEIVAVPPALGFSVTTQMPTSLVVTFTLVSDYPMQWILTLLNPKLIPPNVDLTQATSAGLVITPSGGEWSTPSLTVTVTMDALFMNALGPGEYHLFMTGVNQRGLSGFAEVVLTVTP